ncbi:DUF262 domain-containing protein [Erwinia aphidicola]|uniref:DUF262 domain-containing protein n=1 Tax=Erwinia aphidicola TaxID=68334 RepID=UPI00209DF9D1|nr:DUF262 domain-containing protein [Erwinia aphidicola]MCP2231847.1 hypothetical protein [Erwinia aphidicola]
MNNKIIDDNEINEWFESEEEIDEKPIDNTQLTIEEKFSQSQLRVIRTSMDFTLHHLKQSLEDKEYINASPKYQRRHRWDIKKRSQLIESFLMNIPVPPVFLYENNYNQYEIMDGRQRIDTLRSFMNNEFPLRGLEFWKELEAKRHHDLPQIIQRGLARRTINAVVLLAETMKDSNDDMDIRKILFKRLNTGGVQLNPQELRNALYPGDFNELVSKLSRYPTFTEAWGIPDSNSDENNELSQKLIKNTLFKSMADCELVLRYFAIKRIITENAKGSLRSILDRTAKQYQFLDIAEIKRHEEDFKKTIDGLYDIFQEELFIMPSTGKLSRPLYDAFMVAYSNLNISEIGAPDDIKRVIHSVQPGAKEYDILTGKGNTTESIRERIDLATEILKS